MPAKVHNCLDCKDKVPEDLWPDDVFFCEHWRPEFWVAKGFKRDWGDGAVMNWPTFEMLRLETDGRVEYVVLAPTVLKSPLHIKTTDLHSWGGYICGSTSSKSTMSEANSSIPTTAADRTQSQ